MGNKLFCLLFAPALLSGCATSPATPPDTSSTPSPAVPAETGETAPSSAAPSAEPTLHLSEEAYSWDTMQPVGIWGNPLMRS